MAADTEPAASGAPSISPPGKAAPKAGQPGQGTAASTSADPVAPVDRHAVFGTVLLVIGVALVLGTMMILWRRRRR